jgi:hypothetical protein
MKDQDLDRVIDAAAQQMVSGEPSDALTGAVIARIGAAADAPRPQPFVWATVSVGAIACAVIAVTLLTRGPEPISPNPVRSSSIQLTAEPPSSVDTQPRAVIENIELSRRRVERRPRDASQFWAGLKADTTANANAVIAHDNALEPIPFESFAPQPIDIAAITIESATVGEIVVDPIIIEPLSASND